MAADETLSERRWHTTITALRGFVNDEATPQGSQHRLWRAYVLAEIVGYELEVPKEQRCRRCQKRPRLPYNPRCEKCEGELSTALDALDAAWQSAPSPFTKFDAALTTATCDAIRAWRERKSSNE